MSSKVIKWFKRQASIRRHSDKSEEKSPSGSNPEEKKRTSFPRISFRRRNKKKTSSASELEGALAIVSISKKFSLSVPKEMEANTRDKNAQKLPNSCSVGFQSSSLTSSPSKTDECLSTSDLSNNSSLDYSKETNESFSLGEKDVANSHLSNISISESQTTALRKETSSNNQRSLFNNERSVDGRHEATKENAPIVKMEEICGTVIDKERPEETVLDDRFDDKNLITEKREKLTDQSLSSESEKNQSLYDNVDTNDNKLSDIKTMESEDKTLDRTSCKVVEEGSQNLNSNKVFEEIDNLVKDATLISESTEASNLSTASSPSEQDTINNNCRIGERTPSNEKIDCLSDPSICIYDTVLRIEENEPTASGETGETNTKEKVETIRVEEEEDIRIESESGGELLPVSNNSSETHQCSSVSSDINNSVQKEPQGSDNQPCDENNTSLTQPELSALITTETKEEIKITVVNKVNNTNDAGSVKSSEDDSKLDKEERPVDETSPESPSENTDITTEISSCQDSVDELHTEAEIVHAEQKNKDEGEIVEETFPEKHDKQDLNLSISHNYSLNTSSPDNCEEPVKIMLTHPSPIKHKYKEPTVIEEPNKSSTNYYPKELNPFGDDDSEEDSPTKGLNTNTKVTARIHLENNYIKENDTNSITGVTKRRDISPEHKNTSSASPNVRNSTPNKSPQGSYRKSLNPFGDSDEDDNDDGTEPFANSNPFNEPSEPPKRRHSELSFLPPRLPPKSAELQNRKNSNSSISANSPIVPVPRPRKSKQHHQSHHHGSCISLQGALGMTPPIPAPRSLLTPSGSTRTLNEATLPSVNPFEDDYDDDDDDQIDDDSPFSRGAFERRIPGRSSLQVPPSGAKLSQGEGGDSVVRSGALLRGSLPPSSRVRLGRKKRPAPLPPGFPSSRSKNSSPSPFSPYEFNSLPRKRSSTSPAVYLRGDFIKTDVSYARRGPSPSRLQPPPRPPPPKIN